MAIDDMVIYEGEFYYVVGETLAKEPNSDQSDSVMHALAWNRMDNVTKDTINRAVWVNISDCHLPISTLHYYGSEWYRGVLNGGGGQKTHLGTSYISTLRPHLT